MKFTKRNSALVATALAGAMLLSACGGDDDNGSGSEGSGSGGGTFSMFVSEPENPLIPGNTTESEGDQVVNALWTGLVKFSEEGEVQFDGVAESIESEDNQSWTITLKDGWTFHDGTPVDAESFVNAWNYTANPENAQDGGSYLSRIAGFQEVQDGAATELSGLAVEDDLTFTVELEAPFALFPAVVGYNSFYPLPEVFFEDPDAFGKQPVGNGPFQAEEEWVPGEGVTLTKYEDYAGDDAAQADAVEFMVYADVATAYTDAQDGNVDIIDVIPADVIESAQSEFGDRFIETESSQITYLGFPTYDARYADPRVRQAISMAIDREAISEAIFAGTRTPADSFVAPVVDGYREGACEFCAYDPEAAKALLEESGFDTSQPVELWFNAGASHDAWMEAVGNQLRQNLGLEFQLRGDLDFAQYLPLGESKGWTGPYRYGWSFDYPAAESYLTPLFTEQSQPPLGSNYSFYADPQVSDLIAQGDQAGDEAEAIELYNQAEDIIAEAMPMAPLFFTEIQSVHTENVSNVRLDLFQRVVLSEVTVN
ncbi:peptide/nickel transport system substrate-binding protein/oligopeptide transport system substrate-binding protein [Blastococcus aggregatus]|uniref:Peptide/nickel transport system substrate-binding protein/oligopeptide transport system substrate-binding protein n=1 Tax=Blastococcus aggregatus TaxID=38502 RepID=A0A285UYJ4_9ACTN|nr:ABC transporter substrate-binding protein [Blastococcus aggregatus]SOC46863.1 peptide/nickel transport system substrate-binding protein/oligopeptide transport system substrate-binding protein [Blastococcus aggregatus]